MKTLGGIPLRYIALATLVVQNSALVLILRYSRTIPGPRYFTSTAVFFCELFKLVISFIVYLSSTPSFSVNSFVSDLFGPQSQWYKLTIPAILYTIQNNLQYVAASNLDAATFQVTYQMKILTTALCSVWLLRKSLSAKKWMALLILTIGIALVQVPVSSSTPSAASHSTSTTQQTSDDSHSPSHESHSSSSESQNINRSIGLFSVSLACLISGLAGVYFEKILKNSTTSLWLRNIQLSFFSLFPCIFSITVIQGSDISQFGFFHGYNMITWTAIATQAAGGIIVALVVKYADNILKGFATSISIILSSLLSVYLFEFIVSWNFGIGAAMVIMATYVYGLPDAANVEKIREKSPKDEKVMTHKKKASITLHRRNSSFFTVKVE